jgi:hypothetical protein
MRANRLPPGGSISDGGLWTGPVNSDWLRDANGWPLPPGTVVTLSVAEVLGFWNAWLDGNEALDGD